MNNHTRASHCVAWLLLLGMALLALTSIAVKSLTFDEVAHIPAGFSYLKTRDFRLNLEQPPLVKILAALPLLATEATMPGEAEAWHNNEQYQFGQHFLYQSGNDAKEITYLARLGVIILMLLLGYFVFLWSSTLFGRWGGLLSLALYVMSPNILAHGRLVTMDLGLACFGFIACYFSWRYLTEGTRGQFLLSALFLGLALVTKFSAVLFIPVVFIGYTIHEYRNNKANPKIWLGRLVLLSALAGVISIACVFAAYGFRGDALKLYIEGFQKIYWNQIPGYQFYLGGTFSSESWWYYYLYALIVKTPISTLLFAAFAFGLIAANRAIRNDLRFVVLPIGIFLLVSAFDTRNLGLRRILPIYPFLFVACGCVVQACSNHRRQLGIALVSLLLVWNVYRVATTHPDYLSYFNEVAGGTDGGIYHLDDSNLDWGQDLLQLRRYLERNKIAEIGFFYFGQADPGFHRIPYRQMSAAEILHGPKAGSGYYAISAHNLVRLRLRKAISGEGVDWLSLFKPHTRIGSIYLYHF